MMMAETPREIFKKKLLSLLNEGISFKRETIEIFDGYIVYIFLKRNKPIYIGMSRYGIRRALSRQNRSKEVLEQYDRLWIYRANDFQAAKDAEKILITALNPEYNRTGAVNREAEIMRAFMGKKSQALIE